MDAKNFVFINLYNPNTEKKQVEILNTLLNIIKTIDITKILEVPQPVEVLQLSKRNPLQN